MEDETGPEENKQVFVVKCSDENKQTFIFKGDYYPIFMVYLLNNNSILMKMEGSSTDYLCWWAEIFMVVKYPENMDIMEVIELIFNDEFMIHCSREFSCGYETMKEKTPLYIQVLSNSHPDAIQFCQYTFKIPFSKENLQFVDTYTIDDIIFDKKCITLQSEITDDKRFLIDSPLIDYNHDLAYYNITRDRFFKNKTCIVRSFYDGSQEIWHDIKLIPINNNIIYAMVTLFLYDYGLDAPGFIKISHENTTAYDTIKIILNKITQQFDGYTESRTSKDTIHIQKSNCKENLSAIPTPDIIPFTEENVSYIQTYDTFFENMNDGGHIIHGKIIDNELEFDNDLKPYVM